MKLVAVLSLIGAVVTAIESLWYLLVIWLPIWSSVLLIRAAACAKRARDNDSEGELVDAMNYLRIYFLITGVLVLGTLVLGVGVLLGLGLAFI